MMLFKCLMLIIVSASTFTAVIAFSTDQNNFDAYGPKIAANDVFFAKALNAHSSFSIRHAPFNYSLTCIVDYEDENHYIYSVAVARQMSTNDVVRLVFVGINMATKIPFIGSIHYTGISGPDFVATMSISQSEFPCDGWNVAHYVIYSMDIYLHGSVNIDNTIDFFVVTVERYGRFAYAFANKFIVFYNFTSNNVSVGLGNSTWLDTSFLPRAVDISQNMSVVVLGFIASAIEKYTPCAYLITQSGLSFTVVDTWIYTPPTSASWQASLTNWDAHTYSAKYDMSVSFNDIKDQVILGIPVTNTIFLLSVNQNTQKFILPAEYLVNGKGIGMGKAVGWLKENVTMVLVNTYSLSYVWSASQIVTYNIDSVNNFTMKSTLPNSQQPWATAFGPTLLSLVVTSKGTVIILDSDGETYILLPSPRGSFSDSSKSSVSSSTLCFGGSYSSQDDIAPCLLCPQGFSTNGLIGQTSCTACSQGAFCPLGSSFGNISLSSSLFINFNQTSAYPASPQSVRFDNILMLYMFVIDSATVSKGCLHLSPIFWALISVGIGAVITIIIIILKYCARHQKGIEMRQRLEQFFKHTDLVGEGELWIGGIFSFAVVVFVIFAYTFSHLFYIRYPIEDVNGEATFACDRSLMNTQFSSSLMPVIISPSKEEAPIFELLNKQPFTFRIDFINTLFSCNDVSVSQKKANSIPLNKVCTSGNGSLSVSTPLPSHIIDLQIQLDGNNVIGGIQFSFDAPGAQQENENLHSNYTLNSLSFSQTLFASNSILTQQPSFTIQLTKTINRTYPLSETGRTRFNGAWLSNIIVQSSQAFDTESEYKVSSNTGILVSLTLTETSYYVLNIQRPIADEAELIFTNLLFTLLALEIVGLFFLMFRLFLFPIAAKLISLYRNRKCCITNKKKYEDTELDRF